MARTIVSAFLCCSAVTGTFWWDFPGSDCDSCDLQPSQSLPPLSECPAARGCQQGRMSEACVAKLQAVCEATAGCNGFNTDRIFKNASCLKKVAPLPAAEECIDVYVVGDAPVPPTLVPPVWPLPVSMRSGTHTVSLPRDGSFAFTVDKSTGCVGDASPLLQSAAARFTALLKPSNGPQPKGSILPRITVCVTSTDEALGPATNESYSLTVPNDGSAAAIKAATVFGAMHAMESFVQLVGISSGEEYGDGIISIAPVQITDAPRYAYRGLMIDTGRHFLPKAFVKRIINAMAQIKLNVLHWHLVDSQSFPCGSDTYPQLAAKGAYSSVATFSPADLREIVAHATERGVRVMPEWDMPGHGAWWHGMPDLMASPTSAVMDPTNEALYPFLLAFLGEMRSIFHDPYLFLGGDEVDVGVWDRNPKIASWLVAHNMTSKDLQKYFWQRMGSDVLPKLNRTLAVWENNVLQIDPAVLPKDSVVNVYQALQTATETLRKGLRTTVSIASSNWYLDSECGGYNQNAWRCIYGVDPGEATKGVPAAQAALLLGGEVAMWSEGINKDNFDAFVWRGAAAAAERLWSPIDQTAWPQGTKDPLVRRTTSRLATQACRMSKRGVAIGPVGPSFCPTDASDASVLLDGRTQQELAEQRAEIARFRPALSAMLI